MTTTKPLMDASERYMSEPIKYVDETVNRNPAIIRPLEIDVEGNVFKMRYHTVQDEIVKIELLVDSEWQCTDVLSDLFVGFCADDLANLQG